MRRPLFILAAMLIAGVTVFLAGQRLAGYWCAKHMARPTDDLAWLRLEFRLNDADLTRVRQLHDGYLPKCREFCERIDARKRELQAVLASGTNAPPVIEQKLIEVGTLRAQCQAAMLQHFREVSQVMPPEQGRRYLAEMQRLTLGFHEQIERTCRPTPPARMDIVDTEAQDRADMARLVSGHDAALTDLMDRRAPAVFHFLCRMLGNEDDASDLAQDTFVRVYRARESYEPEQRFTTWLFTIAGNLARNQLRWRSRRPNVSLDAESETTGQTLGDTMPSTTANPHEATVATERAEAVRAAVQALPDDVREAIVLCEWEDMALAEAAAVLQTTPKAIESRLYRARQLLRERLKKWL